MYFFIFFCSEKSNKVLKVPFVRHVTHKWVELSDGCHKAGWDEVTLTPIYPGPSLTGRTFPNPGWHLPTNIGITPPRYFRFPNYGGGHASLRRPTWTTHRYIANVFRVADAGDGVEDGEGGKNLPSWQNLSDSQTPHLAPIKPFTYAIAQVSLSR